MHGSTVTYKSVVLKISASYVFRISSMATSSACLIPYNLSAIVSYREEGMNTDLDSLV